MSRFSVKGFFIGFLAGGTVGAIVALLTTPKSGKELRGDIKQKSEEVLKDAERVFNDAKAKTKDVLHTGKEKMDTETERLKSSVKAGIDAYNEAKKS